MKRFLLVSVTTTTPDNLILLFIDLSFLINDVTKINKKLLPTF